MPKRPAAILSLCHDFRTERRLWRRETDVNDWSDGRRGEESSLGLKRYLDRLDLKGLEKSLVGDGQNMSFTQTSSNKSVYISSTKVYYNHSNSSETVNP